MGLPSSVRSVGARVWERRSIDPTKALLSVVWVSDTDVVQCLFLRPEVCYCQLSMLIF